ncbi:uncharacterized protein LOC117288128 isoform X1 [Asterias rubens]|uniref:uncharacterized protein LOC117288128 isoform X1 n=1 Tax=Asterias rubens TaxID=7604 RepID=UPI001455C80A|nr:uncharacterized protein LOC117288128 isoform X1 [Asterias rubens]
MGSTARPSVYGVVFLLVIAIIWGTVTEGHIILHQMQRRDATIEPTTIGPVAANSCDSCTTLKCAIHCSGFGKRSGPFENDNLKDVRKIQSPPLESDWTNSQQCTLDVWFDELSPEWQRYIIGIFQIASSSTRDPL